MTSFELYLIIIAGFGVILVTCLLLFILCIFSAEHERRRKQATLEHLNVIRGNIVNSQEQLQETLRRNEEKYDNMSDNDKKSVQTYLDTLEQLAICVNMSLLDMDLVRRYYGNLLLQAQECLQSYIEHARFNLLQPTAYMELEELCGRIKEKRDRDLSTKEVRST